MEEGGKEEWVEMGKGIGNRGRTKREGRKDKRGGRIKEEWKGKMSGEGKKRKKKWNE